MKKVILIILDGWGHGTHPASDIIYQANVPFVKGLYQKFPHSELITHSGAVGLPEGQMGNSEVGHLNLGAGRIVYQEFQRINKAIEKGELALNASLNHAFEFALKNKKKLHFIGLVSEGGVHSHSRHLFALCDLAKEKGLKDVFIHAFTDGRDCDPKSGLGYLQDLQKHLDHSIGRIASVCGRYYAMDRDKRWERVKVAYDLMTKGTGKKAKNIFEAVKDSYAENVTDEFMQPIVSVNEENKPLALIEDGDVVICFNFRTDRCREITVAFTQQDFPEFGMKKMDLHYITMTIYDHTYINVQSIFHNEDLKMTLGEVIEKNKLKQIRISETEKYPHVTFFFSGGRERPFEGEQRIMIPSPKVATYDLKPEMSAAEVKNAIIPEIKKEETSFICLNFANADMVGHTGVFPAAIKAVETVDLCVKEIVAAALQHSYSVLLTADHGNCDYLINEDGSPNTAHTKNPVPLFLIEKQNRFKLKNGKLADVAPTILKLLEIPQPAEMTGDVLIY